MLARDEADNQRWSHFENRDEAVAARDSFRARGLFVQLAVPVELSPIRQVEPGVAAS